MSEEDLAEIHRDLHTHPELSFQEERTAQILADRLREWGDDVTTGIGGTGVVGILDNGPGPTVLLRADMDGLPMAEKTGLDDASSRRAVDRLGNDVPVMHARGHDVHVTCLLGAASVLRRNVTTTPAARWSCSSPPKSSAPGPRRWSTTGCSTGSVSRMSFWESTSRRRRP